MAKVISFLELKSQISAKLQENIPVFHFDFYRTNKPEDILDIGYEEYFFSGSYCFLEWPEKIVDLLPESHIFVSINENETDHTRTIIFGKNEKVQ